MRKYVSTNLARTSCFSLLEDFYFVSILQGNEVGESTSTTATATTTAGGTGGIDTSESVTGVPPGGLIRWPELFRPYLSSARSRPFPRNPV